MGQARHARHEIGVGEDHKRMTVDGVELAYEDRGEGDLVVCLHATGHGARDFGPLRERLGHRYRFVTLDWPGQGRSGDDHVPASAARYAALLAGFLDALGLERPILLGNSIGGAAAIGFAAAHPERARALVLANPGGLVPVDATTRAACRVLAAFFRAGARGARWFPAAFAAYYRIVLRAPAARAQRARIVAAGRELAPVLTQAWESFASPDADLRPLAPGVRCPVLFTWARQDRILSYARSEPGIARFPDRRVQRMNGGHAAFLEDPDVFAAAFDAFADALAAGTAR
jgi:4,5:9,10-diseco-3-hydroxy-5,9,17-trioxoandrosta-1(10),2-diene-4-oate hydrolase